MKRASSIISPHGPTNMRARQLSLAIILCAAPLALPGQRVNSRVALNALLAPGALTEGFESLITAQGTAHWISIPVLNATTNVPGHGTGMVLPGLQISAGGGGNLQVNGAGYFGSSSVSIVGGDQGQPNANSRTLYIQFLNPVTAFGVDVFDFRGYTRTVTVGVISPSNTLLGSFMVGAPSAPAQAFVGWQDLAGIGGVVLVADTRYPWSPIIDNVTYGRVNVVPEPATVTLMASGLLALAAYRRRKRR